MADTNFTWGKGCAILAAILIGIPLLVVGVVGVRTWVPLQGATGTMAELDRSLGGETTYRPAPSGAIPAERMETFLVLRARLSTMCGEDYAKVRRGFDAVDSLEARDPGDLDDVGDVAYGLGGAALAITPFLARFFEARNKALLEVSVGLEEYSYIYALAYRERLLSERTRHEIFSAGVPLSPEASRMLRGILARQMEATPDDEGAEPRRRLLAAELAAMEADSTRLPWQDAPPAAVSASLAPFRERLDQVFCGATAGLEMEREARRALRIALE